MKKLSTFLIVFCFSLSSNAQTFLKTFKDYPSSRIPQEFTTKGNFYFYSDNNNTKTKLPIYNERYELVRVIDVPGRKIIWGKKTEKKDKSSGVWYIDSEDIDERSFLYYSHFNYIRHENGIRSFFTQTLFSNDDKFEFFVPIDIETTNTIQEYDSDKDGEIDTRRTTISHKFSGVNVISEDGDVLATFRADGFFFTDKREIRIETKGDNIYIIFTTDDENNPYALYKINRSGSNDPSLSRKEGDLTGDGKVDVADHVKLSEIIMNQ